MTVVTAIKTRLRRNTLNKEVQVSFRVTPELDHRIGDLAKYHGRNRSDEMRLALFVHNARATLAYLNSPDGELELGERLHEARQQVERDLEELEAEVYAHRLPPMLGSDLVMH